MTREEAEKRIEQADKMKDVLDHLDYIDSKLRKYAMNLQNEPGENVYLEIMYPVGDTFVEDRIRDILLHLYTKYENQLKDIQ